MLNVNTIEFNGQKACINSWSDHPALVDDIIGQIDNWRAQYPNATVKTERMTESETRKLVASHAGPGAAYHIGQASKGR